MRRPAKLVHLQLRRMLHQCLTFSQSRRWTTFEQLQRSQPLQRANLLHCEESCTVFCASAPWQGAFFPWSAFFMVYCTGYMLHSCRSCTCLASTFPWPFSSLLLRGPCSPRSASCSTSSHAVAHFPSLKTIGRARRLRHKPMRRLSCFSRRSAPCWAMVQLRRRLARAWRNASCPGLCKHRIPRHVLLSAQPMPKDALHQALPRTTSLPPCLGSILCSWVKAGHRQA